jgi:RimJ/RimL family protein N-acetyltransferase
VVPARARDALDCLALRRDVLAEGEWFITEADELTTTVDDEEARIRAAQGAGHLYLVARLERVRVAGLLTVHTGPLRRMAHAGKLEIMVGAPYRGQGIGRALLRAACDWADASEQVEKLGLTVFAGNERAQALYRSLGFAQEGRRIAEYKLADGSYRDDVLMGRRCTA